MGAGRVRKRAPAAMEETGDAVAERGWRDLVPRYVATECRHRRDDAASRCRDTPVLLSASRISPASKSRSSHRSPRISFRLHPVSTSRRIAAAAWTDASPSAGAASSACPSR